MYEYNLSQNIERKANEYQRIVFITIHFLCCIILNF